MSVLNIWSYASHQLSGGETTAKQGTRTDAPQTPFAITAADQQYDLKGSLSTATVQTLWDEDSNFPATFLYAHIWADQIAYVQLIAQGTNVIHRLAAKVPFVLPGYSTILAAANTTIMDGGTEPTLSQIDSIVLGNWSGSTLNFHLLLVL
jgi:hypothetical protein